MPNEYRCFPRGAAGGWQKLRSAPVMTAEAGRAEDPCVLWNDGRYQMWYTWPALHSIAYTESTNGLCWALPRVALSPRWGSDWEGDAVGQPAVVKHGGRFHLWYAGRRTAKENEREQGCIGYAVSDDGLTWERGERPVLAPRAPWEKRSVCYPAVLYDERRACFRMWYSAGEAFLPDAIGYAESADGARWTRCETNPVFAGTPERYCESVKVLAAHAVQTQAGICLFYNGFDGDGRRSACLAFSEDGLAFRRHPDNPVVTGSDGTWDFNAVHKACALQEADGWKMWYAAQNYRNTEIGLAVHPGTALFPAEADGYVPERGPGDNAPPANNFYYHQYNFAGRPSEYAWHGREDTPDV